MTKLYTGVGVVSGAPPDNWPSSPREQLTDPRGYYADPGLVDAVNVALLLSRPLLVTGDPGTGKTELARSVAAELGLGERLRFDTKSTSTAKDLFYSFDAVSRFQSKQAGEGAQPIVNYLTYQALGEAILQTKPKDEIADLVPPPPSFRHDGPKRSVVLIDEIDKAPRDFTNDLLAELANMYFHVRELRTEPIIAQEDLRPVVIVTSNSEKQLPDAFLRRCVYYDIPFPESARLKQILENRIPGGTSPFFDDAIDLFQRLRNDRTGLQRQPATAELLDWMLALRGFSEDCENPLAEDPQQIAATLNVLVKNREDQPRARDVVNEWINSRNQ